jgi:hypothetical protein
MPEKQNNNKIMAMLERRGIIRKAEDDLPETDSSDKLPRSEPDIKALFDPPADDSLKVTPAARQPIPGMPTPIFPSEKPESAPLEQSGLDDSFKTKQEMPVTIEEPEPSGFTEVLKPEPPEVIAPPRPEPPEVMAPPRPEPPEAAAAPPPRPEPQEVAEPPKPAPVFGNLNPFRSAAAFEEKPPAPPVQPAVAERAPQPENYTDRYLNTDELYDALALRSKKTDTIYLIEEYLQTLPASLPDTSRREIVGKLLAASGFDYDLLMGDGVLRVKMLKEYAERFARHTDDYIAARQAELDEYDQQILRTRRLIENRKELHKKQFFSIEAEAQRLKDILTFISG